MNWPIPAQRPFAMTPQQPAPQQSGFMSGLRNNSDMLLAASAGLLGGRTGPEQFALGMQGVAHGRQLARDKQNQNRTVEWLRGVNPQLAQAVELGALTPGDAYKHHLSQVRTPQPTSLMRNLEAAGLKPGTPEYQQAILANQTKPLVDMGDSGPQVGSIPQGYQLTQGEGGAWQMAPIPGGPEDTSQQDALNQRNRGVQGALVEDEIDIAKHIIQNASWPTTGVAGGILANVDSTEAGALKNRLETIKANIGFDKLQSMRDASPTGGALGQVSEFENRLLQAVYGSLAQSQTADDLLYNLQRVQDVYTQIVHQGIPDNQAREMYRQEMMSRYPGSQGATQPNREVDDLIDLYAD